MRRGLSTHLFLEQRLTPGLLDSMLASGVDAIEIFAARHHFDYTDRAAVREIANWFGSHPAEPRLHMPLFSAESALEWSRHTAATLNLISPSKNDRIEAQDEVKRALEAAEQVPFRSCVLHLGLRDDSWDTRAIDDSLTAIEHLKAFATPLGVQLLLENLQNDVATPEHLVEITRIGHFDTVGFCLDLGHAHLAESVPETRDAPARDGVTQALDAFGKRLVELHVHDNNGMRDEHLWPGGGSVGWESTSKKLQRHAAETGSPLTAVLEIAHALGNGVGTDALREQVGRAWATVEPKAR